MPSVPGARNPHLAYVRQTLAAVEDGGYRHPRLRFFRRAEHCARVLMWAERLMAQTPVESTEAVRLAAAFHDIGYAVSEVGHAAHSARMLRDYGAARGFSAALTEAAVSLVARHSDKETLLGKPGTPSDLTLLMEADLLDGEGAMGLVMDAMSAALSGAEDFDAVYAHMCRYEPARLAENPMVTPLARQLWAEKQALIRAFLCQFERDLYDDPISVRPVE